MTLTRTLASLMLAATVSLSLPAWAQDKVWRHGISLMGELKYPEGFTQFDYVNPDAPKGGTVRLSDLGGFDTFNPILPQGEVASGLGYVLETLMSPSLDETSTSYGLLAEALSYPDDISSVTFRMNPKAKWHDGEPVTAEDALWSFNKIIELSPSMAQYYANVTKAEVTAPGEITFTFDQTGNRELPSIMGQLSVLPQHWWEGTDANGKQRDIGASTLEPIMGSGPYQIGKFNPGTSITYTRVPDYWGKDTPFGIGQDNFDEVRYEFFLDTDVQFEAFKGDQFDWRVENKAARWATAYDFPAASDGRVVKELFENDNRDTGLMVGYLMNLRRDKFQDPRVREALTYGFDFEELNRTLFYQQYSRINSYFYGTDLASSGLPEGEELEILESVKDLVSARVFTEAFANPVAGDATKLRANLRTALGLLTEAGYTLDGNRLIGADGKQLAIEILIDGPTNEPIATAFQANLQTIGIDVTVRTVDSAQYINRIRSRDFDMIYSGWLQTLSPGNEQRSFWGSAAAGEENSSNYMGVSDPGIDALIDKVIYADDRETLVAATHALDRVLLANRFAVPSYTLLQSRIARWDRFGHPETLPEYSIGFPSVWWWDAEKAAKVGGQ